MSDGTIKTCFALLTNKLSVSIFFEARDNRVEDIIDAVRKVLVDGHEPSSVIA